MLKVSESLETRAFVDVLDSNDYDTSHSFVTEPCLKTTEPQWNETFEVEIHDRSRLELYLCMHGKRGRTPTVRWNTFGKDVRIGNDNRGTGTWCYVHGGYLQLDLLTCSISRQIPEKLLLVSEGR